MKTRTHYSRSDTGMVSLMVTIIMMMVITMIVLGFAQISRREQRQTLDRQLSTQAFLAAESGINDARQAIQTSLQTGGAGSVPEKTTCDNSNNRGASDPYRNLDGIIDSGDNVAYTCLLVSTKLDDIKQNITYDGSDTTIPINPLVTSGPLKVLHLKWGVSDSTQAADSTKCAPTVQTFTSATAWRCPFGVLRVTMVPTDSSQLNRQSLLTNQKTFFLYPTRPARSGPAPVTDYGRDNGAVRAMACTDTGCQADITNIGGSNDYAMRVSSMYVDGSINISAESASGSTIPLTGTQALIDVTGKAQDVLRRVQVRLSLISTNKTPGVALESGSSICKRFEVGSNKLVFPGDILARDATNPMCAP